MKSKAPEPEGRVSSPSRQEPNAVADPRIVAEQILSAEILFYGQVVDQDGSSIPDAVVEYYYDGKRVSDSTSPGNIVRSDASGKFSISGVTGSRLSVVASKEGYDHTTDLGNGVGSARNFDFGAAADRGRPYMDSKNPSKITLVRKGELEPTVHCEGRYQPLSANGPMLRVFLDEQGMGHAVDFELNVDPDAKPLGGAKLPYAWSVVIKASKGKVVEQKGIGYLAPDSGYSPEVHLGYDSHQLGDGWRSVASPKKLFVRFDDGTHALLKLDVYSESKSKCLFLEYWFNPKSGSRQLAPGKEVVVRRVGSLVPRN